jgi:hypothetical protein
MSEIAEEAKATAQELGRTVHRYLEGFRDLDEEVRRQFRDVRWPDSLEDGDIPWEASTEVLALLEWTEKHNLRPPTVNIAAWYWRSTLMIPGAPLDLRLRVALTLATHREIGEPVPEGLRKALTVSEVPIDYRFRVVNGGPSAIWAAEVVTKGIFEPEFKKALFASVPQEADNDVRIRT